MIKRRADSRHLDQARWLSRVSEMDSTTAAPKMIDGSPLAPIADYPAPELRDARVRPTRLRACGLR